LNIPSGITVGVRGGQYRVIENIPCGQGNFVLKLQDLSNPQFTFLGYNFC